MALVLLIRHALTESTGTRLTGTLPGFPLSDTGRAQAEVLAERMAPVKVHALYASPLERCVETADPIARSKGLTVSLVPALREVEYGRWTGRPLAQLARTALWKQVQQVPSTVRFPDGESLAEAQHRSVEALDALAARHPRGVVAVVTHADVIRLALAHYCGTHLDLYQRYIVHPASVSAVLIGSHMPRVLRMNDTGTLADLAMPRRRRPPAPERPRPPAPGRS
jgi:probable phosphomutase (TIGR03848 family)